MNIHLSRCEAGALSQTLERLLIQPPFCIQGNGVETLVLIEKVLSKIKVMPPDMLLGEICVYIQDEASDQLVMEKAKRDFEDKMLVIADRIRAARASA